jgi:DNA-binding MarR family transcriptional regulator
VSGIPDAASARPTRADDEWRHRSPERTSILFDVFALGQQVRTLLHTAMRDAALRPDEYAAYSVLFESGRSTMTRMARELGMPVTTAADYVRAMVARGHVRRQPHPTDQRSHLLALTPSGTRAHREANAHFERAYRALVAELPPLDERATRATLQQLAAAADRATRRMQGHVVQLASSLNEPG